MPGTNGYVVKQVSKQIYDLRKSANQGETSKQKRWLCFRGSLWISLWRWQFFFWLAARGIWRARRWDLKGQLAQTKPLSLLILVFMYITLCLSWWKKLDMVHVSSCQNILKYRVVIDYVTTSAYNGGDRLLERRRKFRLDSGPRNLDSELYLLYISSCQSVSQLEIFSTTTLPMYISQIPVDVQFHLFIIRKIISFIL